MRVKSKPVSSLSPHSFSCSSSPRTRRKHKRLDAICELAYSENHADAGESADYEAKAGNAAEDDSELRRSKRSRRAPVILDASPPPPRKRTKLGMESSGKKGMVSYSLDGVDEDDRLLNADETPESWKSRLRSKGKRRVRFSEKKSPRGKRRLFRDVNAEEKEEPVVVGEILEEQKCESYEDKEELVIESSGSSKQKNAGKVEVAASLGSEGNVAKSKRRRLRRGKRRRANKVKEMVALEDEENRGLLEAVEGVKSAIHELADQGDVFADALPAKTGSCDGIEVVIPNIEESVAADGEEETMPDAAASDAGSTDDSLATNCHADEILEVTDEGGGGFSGPDAEQCKEEADRLEGESGGSDINPTNLDKEPAESGQLKNVEKTRNSSDKRSNIKVGRRCGLCGGGTDGKPPKKLVNETADSDDETYHCSSPSEEPNYDILDGFGDGPDWLGRLLGPVNDRYGIAGIWVHQNCAVWSPEVYFAGLGCLKNVRAALCRGRALKCTCCGRPGATIGCRVDRCPKTYHLPCSRANGCIFDHRKFLIACTDHRHFFRPHGINWLKKMRAKKMKLECRKLSNDASRRDIEAEEKWLENCGEDEEFLKRESRRLHRDLLRISPVYIGGASTEEGSAREGWESVAGLQDVIRCMKEVVLLPLLYPEFFDNLGLTPPRGVLLHGYPGTGKTLVVRALIGACARGDRRIAYFARKGADCLGKYVGDAERQLRLLFQVAEKCQPSIIFFDEIDGLAPRRTKQQDQTHSSVVSTLLALLDGLKSRGSVVVIGATNRPDAVDPALRRPGRFDREIYFPLPSLDDRAAILSLHTSKWPKPVSGNLLKFIAKQTASFAGADLQALCTQVAIIALKRNFPLQEILSAAGKDSPGERVPLPSFMVEERDWLEALSRSPPPCSRREAGIAANDIVSSPLPTYLLPCLLEPLSRFLASLHNENLSLPPALSTAALRVKNALFSAMEKRQQPVYCWQTHLSDLLQDSKTVEDIEKGLVSSGLLIEQPISVDSDAFHHDSGHSVLQEKHSVTSNRGTGSLISHGAFYSSSNNAGYRLLICGSSGSGQRHFVSCLLHCYIGNVEVQKIDLATVSQEGHGDTVQGIAQILMKCASVGSSIVFMPRIDLWALETHSDVSDEEDNSKEMESESRLRGSHSHEVTESKNLEPSSTQAWNSFIEQAEALCVNTSLVVLATSEIDFVALPYRVRQFFRSGVHKRSQSAHSEHAFPRFCINLGANVDFDMVVERSIVKLSSDIVQQFVQLIHKKYHFHSTSRYVDPVPEVVPNGRLTDGGLDSMAQRLDDTSLKTAQVANKRNLKGKSSLLLAISAFGLQILRYPHFAELCWVTSKLKEGPVADIRGPWKGWPFNSCIIRPYNESEGTAVASSPGNVKIEEKYGLVRGLVAVGLLAYKGIYESAKEVSFEIRCVLETLVGQINMKIQAGKDKYDYFRILSQVSYLEDLVNSWAYSLQSLESDAQVTISKATLTGIQNTKQNSLRPEDLEPQNSVKVVAEEEVLEGIGLGAGVENNGGPDLNGFDGDVGCSAFSENPGNTVDANNLVDKTEGVDIKHAVADSTKAPENNGILCENVASSSGALEDMEIMDVDGSASRSKDEPIRDAFRDGAGSEEVCIYRCCLGCLSSLHELMQKLLEGKWGSDRSEWTTEVIHDGVASLSVDLLSVLRNGCMSTGSSNVFGETEDRVTISKRCSCSSCSSKLSDPAECECHSAGGDGESGGVCARNVEFTIRNGVLEPGVPDKKDGNYECEFEKLCLCSLIEWVATLVEQKS